jgi:hypothetical protein
MFKTYKMHSNNIRKSYHTHVLEYTERILVQAKHIHEQLRLKYELQRGYSSSDKYLPQIWQ